MIAAINTLEDRYNEIKNSMSQRAVELKALEKAAIDAAKRHEEKSAALTRAFSQMKELEAAIAALRSAGLGSVVRRAGEQ